MHYLNSLAAFLRFKKNFIGVSALLLACLGVPAVAQSYHHEVETGDKTSVSVKSRNGRVSVIATDDQLKKVSIEASSAGALVDQTDVLTVTKGGDVNITVRDRRDKDRIDLVVRVPVRTKVKVESEAGAVDVVGNLESAEVSTNTGTIHADVPLDAVKFNFLWTASRPRFLSDVELPKIKEKAAGAFAISGKLPDKKSDKEEKSDKDEESDRDKDSDKNKESALSCAISKGKPEFWIKTVIPVFRRLISKYPDSALELVKAMNDLPLNKKITKKTYIHLPVRQMKCTR